ncbi:MAG: NAD(P)H-hydrate dehydratase [Pyrinomonadaceae bacterium]
MAAIKAKLIGPALLRRWPLPWPDAGGTKEGRGRVLVVGGSAEMPGALILAAEAAFRAGAGKVQLATCRGVALHIATAVPASRVFALAETKRGGLVPTALAEIEEYVAEAEALLVGPGMTGEPRPLNQLLKKLCAQARHHQTVVFDATALYRLCELKREVKSLGGRAILTPHAEEMSKLMGLSEEEIARSPQQHARESAAEFGAVVALKGRETYVASPDGELYVNRAGNVGLATSGSGDVLAGLVAGLAARGATALQAAVWGVHLHALAGDRLAQTVGSLGYFARELPPLVPGLLDELTKGRRRR